jgi:hypothetical protein
MQLREDAQSIQQSPPQPQPSSSLLPPVTADARIAHEVHALHLIRHLWQRYDSFTRSIVAFAKAQAAGVQRDLATERKLAVQQARQAARGARMLRRLRMAVEVSVWQWR